MELREILFSIQTGFSLVKAAVVCAILESISGLETAEPRYLTVGQNHLARGRRQGRQRKSWDDIIRKWTSLEFGESQRAVENREKWRKLVAKSSVVPQQPSQLRN